MIKIHLPCLKDIVETFKHEIYNKDYEFFRKYGCEPQVYVFPQTWGSTALGFGGIGGQAMTAAYTTVVEDFNSGWCGVFFGTKLAYIIKNPNQMFFEDMQKNNMEPISRKGKYLREG